MHLSHPSSPLPPESHRDPRTQNRFMAFLQQSCKEQTGRNNAFLARKCGHSPGTTVSEPSTTRIRIASLQGGSVRRGALRASLEIWVLSPAPTWWKEISDSNNLSSDFHICTGAGVPTHASTHPHPHPKIRRFCIACSLAHGSMFCLSKVPAFPTANSGHS